KPAPTAPLTHEGKPTTTDNPAPVQEPDWKVEARKWEARAKENSDAARRLAEIEEASKTEAEKAAERLAALEAENAAFKQEKQVATWATEVSEASGVPVAALRGSTKEELEAHAETLKSLIKADDSGSGPYVPNEGTRPTGGVKSTAQ